MATEQKSPDLDEDDFNSGLILPPLIVQLKKILDQYPDDSQILKELIQNAEDAGAHNVKFLYDRRTYGVNPRSLHHPGLAKFQGPGLYSYNDAEFSEDDWRGIRMLSQSVKATDPFKVGYFGMGFKSVFHISDMPYILSGDKLAVIDPHQFVFPQSTYSWSLNKRDLSRQLYDQVAPFINIFDCEKETFANGHYKGTLFRFPLRMKTSALSETLYGAERIHRLFECFHEDAHLVLIFLRHLESIELYERDERSMRPKLLFKVALTKDCLSEVRAKREEFLSKAKSKEYRTDALVTTYPITVEVTKKEGNWDRKKTYSWLVTNYYSGGRVSATFRKLYKDTDLSFPPWVGVAMPLSEGGKVKAPSEQDGNVFCFLPLPSDRQTPTGLPVHINGFFALEQNRKYIKWPNITQKRDDLMDKRLLWNQCLLREAIPFAYAQLILGAIKLQKEKENSDLTVENIYKAFPDFSKVDRRWECVCIPLYAELFQKHAVVYSEADGGVWLQPREAIFNTLEEDESTKHLIFRILCLSNTKIADMPEHVLRAIRSCCTINLTKITPQLVSQSFKKVQSTKKFKNVSRVNLLRYLLKQNKYELLDGLDLLPLANGQFTMFFSNPRRAERFIYIATGDQSKDILPKVEDDFLDPNLDPGVTEQLIKAAVKGYTQLRVLSQDVIGDLIQQTLPSDWLQRDRVTWTPDKDGHPSKEWLKNLWVYLQHNFRRDLTTFEGIPLIPIPAENGKGSDLVPLYTLSGIVMRRMDGLMMETNIEPILEKLGLIVIDELPIYIRAHPLVAELYIFAPSFIGILKAMFRMCEHLGLEQFAQRFDSITSPQDKRLLRSMFCRMSPFDLTLRTELKDMLCHLPLFETLRSDDSGSYEFVSASTVKQAAPVEPLPVEVSQTLINVASPDSANLAVLLNIRALTVIELLREIVFPDVEGAYYSSHDIQILMLYVIKHYYSLIEVDATFIDSLQSLTFLPRRDMLMTANMFYDPAEPLLQRLFVGEEKFPTGAYTEQNIIAVLKEIGLRRLDTVEPEDLLETAMLIQESIESGSITVEEACVKSQALMEYLLDFPQKLQMPCEDKVLYECLADIRWVKPQSVKPPFYPEGLSWFEATRTFEVPNGMKTGCYASVIGSTMPIVAVSTKSDLGELYGWNESPPLENVVAHMYNVVQSYDPAQKAKYMDLADSIYEEMSKSETQQILDIHKEQNLTEWIWHGEGFTSSEKIVFAKTFMDLRPVLYHIPKEMEQYSEFFAKCGVKHECDLPGILCMIKTKYEDQSTSHSAEETKRDLHICVSILNELKTQVSQQNKADLESKLVLPLHTKDSKTIVMAKLADCTYCDQEWLRQGYDINDLTDDDEEILLVHPNVPSSTSEALDVPTLMSRMLDAEELDFSFGQSDSLTHRLHVLLQEYTDGFAVPKELVQNADDAGATEVKFLYDERQNEDSMTCLIDEGMKQCHGPALWAYNDAVFTDEDFENITKLSGATKETKTELIGRFGLGFNAVYNITDVPSFISRHNIVIFDPHTTHLGKSIKNKSKPGIKINMQRHKRKLRRLGNQFKPFNDVFGCDMKNDTSESFDATLFRFPLRTKAQAVKSEICHKHYDDSEVRSLLQLLVKGSESLLLFTQNVQQITLYHLGANAKDASCATEVFKVQKAPVRILRELKCDIELSHSAVKCSAATQAWIKQSSILKSSKNTMADIRKGKPIKDISIPESSHILKIDSRTTANGEKVLECSKSVSRQWITTSLFGVGNSLRMALMEENLLPTGGVAVPLSYDELSDLYVPESIFHPDIETQHFGTIFSFLPMPIHSGLPVHINGAFAVTSNRRYLCERNEDDKFDMRAIWNEALMEDSITQAYALMLEDISKISPPGGFTTLWPRVENVESNTEALLHSFYKTLSDTSDYCLPLFSNDKRWVSLKQAVFLTGELKTSKVGDIMSEIFKEYESDNSDILVDLPEYSLQGFKLAQCAETINQRSMNLSQYITKVLLRHIDTISASLRDPLVLYALEHGDESVRQKLQESACIPTSPDGDKLSRPCDLVDPNCELTSLYSPHDGKFPHGEAYTSKRILNILHNLGMSRDDITWDDVVERAKSAENVEYSIGKKRVQTLLSFVQKKLVQNGEAGKETVEQYAKQLRTIPMLPAMARPKHFNMQWHSEDMGQERLLPAADVYPQRCWPLLGCVNSVADESVFPRQSEELKALLGLSEMRPSLDTVLEQLTCILDDGQCIEDRETQDELVSVCCKIYEFFQNEYTKYPEKIEVIVSSLRYQPFIFCNGQFLLPQHVAFYFLHHCAPYLYGLPDVMRRIAGDLLAAVGVRETFETTDFVEALQTMYETYHESTLDKDTLKLALRLVSLLNDSIADMDQTLDDVAKEYGVIYIPDAQAVLRNAKELCYNEPDTQWLPPDHDTKLSHPLIPYAISKQLGVNTRRQEVLNKYSRGIPFGQKEKLTNRLKRILNSYPCDKEILKELLQNADDAGASEIHFVKDIRQHPRERVFDESWKPLQGPALCVYNNMPFTDSDMMGIQRLGEGSKANDPNLTGQYGVGFNCVYHLTDAPSFLTGRPDGRESLCIFDPHGRYVPGASIDDPGRRYDDVNELRDVFTDIFPCYLGDKFNLENSTMFRFPLRTAEMAAESELNDRPFQIEMLDTLFSKFKPEIFDCLLFVNNVQKISISEVDKLTNRLTNTFSVSVTISDEDQAQRKHFSKLLKHTAQDLKNGQIQFWEIPFDEITYEMKLTDNKGTWERWLVVQRLGFEEETNIPINLQEEFRRKDLALLPRGGVACLIDASSIEQSARARKAFCFLPLPIKTDLPVQVNGHFALDHEARRNLWVDDELGPKTVWNMTLISEVIAPAYVSLISVVPAHIGENVQGDTNSETSFFQAEDEDIQDLDYYSALFPKFKTTQMYWKNLVEAVYKTIDRTQAPILPVLKIEPHTILEKTSDDSTGYFDDYPTEVEVEWVPTKGDGVVKPHFDNMDDAFLDSAEGLPGLLTPKSRIKSTPKKLSRRDTLRKVLLASGFKLLRLPMEIYKCFREAGVGVECVSPSNVLRFYQSYNSDIPACHIGSLPACISNTQFHNEATLKIVMEYCMQEKEQFLLRLDQLPFLLSEDGQLRVFSLAESPFLSTFHQLLPDCGSMFIHHSLVRTVFRDVQPEDHTIFQRFDLDALSSLMSNVMDEDKYRTLQGYVKWSRGRDELPSPKWIKTLWIFMRQECNRLAAAEYIEDENLLVDNLSKYLEPLEDWCLLPAHIPDQNKLNTSHSIYDSLENDISEEFLVPMGLAATVVDFSQASIMSNSVRDSLRKLGVPELSIRLLDGSAYATVSKSLNSSSNSNSQNVNMTCNSDLARKLVANLESPKSVLIMLDHCITNVKYGVLNLRHEDCTNILKYFSESIDCWVNDQLAVDTLRGLPLFQTVKGDMLPLGNNQAYVLPSDIPVADMHVWETEAGIIFLRKNKQLFNLHQALGCESLTATDVYINFIFKSFLLLTEEARTIHLQWLKDIKLTQITQQEKEVLVSGLSELEFLQDDNGIQRSANYFFDPYHPVFKVLLADIPSSFPPAPYNEFKWLNFMRMIGLVEDVTPARFVEYAKQVEEEASQKRTDVTFNKSRTLLTHLFQRKNLPTEGLLEMLGDIKFIPPARINNMLQKIYPQFETQNDGSLGYISFNESVPETHEYLVWSSANLLPDWANPYKLNSGDVRNDYEGYHEFYKLEDYKAEIGKLLEIQEEPSVEKVLAHVSNICSVMFAEEEDSNMHDEVRAFVKVDVMKMVYKFLQIKALHSDVAKTALSDVACIIVDMGYTFVKPVQVVINLYEEEQIMPYLYKAPTELGEFKKLFTYLGASLNATVDQYAMVLDSIFEITQGTKMHPNEILAAFKAVQGLFAALEKHPNDIVQKESLFLPSRMGTLINARELVFNDDPSYTDRIKDFDRPFLVDLNECNVNAANYDDLITLLPESLQPVMLTSLVHEMLEESSRETKVAHGIAEKIRHHLHSKAFALGIIRLIRHEHHRSGQRVQQDVLDSIHLKRIRVFGVEKVVTHLNYNGQRIEGSEMESECFVEKTETVSDAGATVETLWNIFVDHSAALSEELLVSVAEVVNRIVGGLLRNSVHYLQPILSCPPHSISKVLDKLKIRPDHSVDYKQPTLPDPGSFIPIEDHHLLEQGFEDFEPGEYVGYELEDDVKEGPTFVYAIILERVYEEQIQQGQRTVVFRRKYKVNVGDDRKPCTAEITDLYKFYRVEGFVSHNPSTNQNRYSFTWSDPPSKRSSYINPNEDDTDAVFERNKQNIYEATRKGFINTNRGRGKPEHQTPNGKRTDNHFGEFGSEKHGQEPSNGASDSSGPRMNGSGPSFWWQDSTSIPNSSQQSKPGGRNAKDKTDFGGYKSYFHQYQKEKQQQKEPKPATEEAEPEFIFTGNIPDPKQAQPTEDVCEEVSDTLEQAWLLPVSQRKKIIKRLLLKWHPDKNIGNETQATVVTQHITAELDRLEQGLPRHVKGSGIPNGCDPRNPFAGTDSFQRNFENAYQFFFDQMNARAKEHKHHRERYKENFSREYSSTKTNFNFDVPPSFSSSNPQPTHARRFFRQAQEDLRSADNDYESKKPAYEWVCFKAHQAAEKALKAAQFFVDAVAGYSHDLCELAATIEDVELKRLALRLQVLIGDHNKLYNPDPIDFVVIPHDEFTQMKAIDAINHATDILTKVKEFMDIRE